MACTCENNLATTEYVEDELRRCRHQKPGKLIMKCGSGFAGPLPILDLAGASIRHTYPVASVTIDTSGLENPTVLLQVTALINAPIGVLANLTFRVVKSCNGATQGVGGSYTHSSAIDTLTGKAFEFQICDCGDCCCCSTYTVEISSATLAQAGTTVSAQISAIAVENRCEEDYK